MPDTPSKLSQLTGASSASGTATPAMVFGQSARDFLKSYLVPAAATTLGAAGLSGYLTSKDKRLGESKARRTRRAIINAALAGGTAGLGWTAAAGLKGVTDVGAVPVKTQDGGLFSPYTQSFNTQNGRLVAPGAPTLMSAMAQNPWTAATMGATGTGMALSSLKANEALAQMRHADSAVANRRTKSKTPPIKSPGAVSKSLSLGKGILGGSGAVYLAERSADGNNLAAGLLAGLGANEGRNIANISRHLNNPRAGYSSKASTKGGIYGLLASIGAIAAQRALQ